MSNVTGETTPVADPVSTPAVTTTPPVTTPPVTTPPVTTPPVSTPPVSTPSTPVTTPPVSTPSTTTPVVPPSSTPPTSTPPVTTPPPASTTPPVTTPIQSTSVVTVTPPDGSTYISVVTTTTFPSGDNNDSSASSTSSSASSSNTLAGQSNGVSKSGLSDSGKIAIEVVVPIIAVALLVLGGIFFWRRRKHQKDAEEHRRKEVEEYGYNPNEDPSLPAVIPGGSSDGPFEMREDGSGGYRGWGATTLAGSSGRKASTTVSGGHSNPGNVPGGMAYSDGASPSHGESRSGEPLVGSPGRPISHESEVLGAMGPAAAENRGGNMHRGPSNASSSYSVANRSDGSGEQPVPGGAYGAAQYYSNDATYGGPYADGSYGGGPGGRAEMGGQPVIRDNLARRATRIENPSHFPTQASAGIAQNF